MLFSKNNMSMTISRLIFSFLILSLQFSALASSSQTLATADSLFKAKRYTESFELYQELYEQNTGTPAMLIKMAYIKEGLGDYSNALLYLDSYYKHTADKKVIEKMHNVASEKNLSGYDFSDYTYMINTINKNKSTILITLTLLSLITLVIIFFKKPKRSSAFAWIFLQILLLLPAMLIVNNIFNEKEAIINSNQTLLMSGPSAASEPIELLDKGNKVKIISESDVWILIETGETRAYVKSGRLLRLF
jgi:uncharacterized protein YgiM (DUF1202 family)